VKGKRGTAALDDEGQVDSWSYKADTVGGTIYQPDTAWNRRPWRTEFGKPAPPRRDHGMRLTPIVGLKTGAGLGFTPKVGVVRTQLGYGNTPYLSRIQLEGSYSFGVGGYKVEVQTDHRARGSRVHLLTHALSSQLEMVEFHGFGNDVPEFDDDFYDVRQTQWMFHPAVGFALGPNSDISLGPVVKYVTTDTTRDQFISQDVPYGAGGFGQAGVQLNLRYDTRDNPSYPQRGISAVVTGSAYPALWDAREHFEEISGVVSTYFGVPIRKGSVLALRGGGKKLFGDFPYYEAAFVGGSSTVRTYRHRQFAGDASLYGSAEVRVPLARFAFFLPLDLGALGFYDTGRVFVKGESGGGWHDAAGAGLWLGILNPNLALNVSLTNRKENRVFVGLGFNY